MTVTPCTSRSSPGSSPRSASRTDSSTSLSQSSRSGILTCTTLFRDRDRDRSLSPHPSCAVLPPFPHLCSSLSSVLLSYDLLCRIVLLLLAGKQFQILHWSSEEVQHEPTSHGFPPILPSASPPLRHSPPLLSPHSLSTLVSSLSSWQTQRTKTQTNKRLMTSPS
jgi:hypothetical protein